MSLSELYNYLLHQHNARAQNQPCVSAPSIFPILNQPITIADIEELKSTLSAHPHSNTSGVNDCTYSLILKLDNNVLCDLYCQCFRTGNVPTAWLITLLSALPKQGKDLSDPNNHCAIALESCFLEFGTLLILQLLTKAAEMGNLIPPTQNGFHAGHCTHNNAFILHLLIECARENNETLYVAFVDISNAFPSTNHNTLWNRLEDLGLTGMYYDWLRSLYSNMHYRLVLGNESSNNFESSSGVLMGDPASPMLWNLYLSTFSLPPHKHDISLNGTTISHLEHADDMPLEVGSHDIWGCPPRVTELSIIDYIVGTFDPSPPCFIVNGHTLLITDCFKYVSVTFCSVKNDIFAVVYDKKSKAATVSSHGILSTECLVGRGHLPPKSAKQLYTMLINCHLIFGCEVVLDITNSAIHHLEKIQHTFFCCILSLSDNSILTPLYTETGICPIRVCHAVLALSYLRYSLELPHNKLAHVALQSLLLLCSCNTPCWLSDLNYVIHHLPHPPDKSPLSLPPNESLTPSNVTDLIKQVNSSSSSFLLGQINDFSHLSLLCSRFKPVDPDSDSTPSSPVIFFCHYLHRVPKHHHCKSLTHLLCGNISPWVFRCSPGRTHCDGDDILSMMCQFCNTSYKTPEHVLIQCNHVPQITYIHSTFLSSMNLDPLTSQSNGHALELLKCWIFDWDLVAATTAFIHNVFIIWKDRCGIPRIDELWSDERE
ncbi:hypothetical protein D9758_001440 [Tetrapyrgos nigripes]|uniref:Reverse transcriptase domain-containing protein n=1 Tax=Tetrapyrgos nigripes TaxID=182062 RepID=A0A8H5GXY5_9AGAR|nr:hypothetical protein D9758_001440 [Tetrapyrgos nigripes]